MEKAPPRSALRASLGRLLRSPRSALRASLGRLRRTHGPTSANRARGAVRGALTRRAGALRPRPRGATWGRPSDRLAAPTRQTACIAHMWSRLHGAHGGNGDPMPSRVLKGAKVPRRRVGHPRENSAHYGAQTFLCACVSRRCGEAIPPAPAPAPHANVRPALQRAANVQGEVPSFRGQKDHW